MRIKFGSSVGGDLLQPERAIKGDGLNRSVEEEDYSRVWLKCENRIKECARARSQLRVCLHGSNLGFLTLHCAVTKTTISANKTEENHKYKL